MLHKPVRGCSAGKTTLLRDVVSLLANKLDKRVVVVDTSNEIGGDGAIPHACLGKARRMPVYDQSKQHEVLLQAVQNHNPQVICPVAAAEIHVFTGEACTAVRHRVQAVVHRASEYLTSSMAISELHPYS